MCITILERFIPPRHGPSHASVLSTGHLCPLDLVGRWRPRGVGRCNPLTSTRCRESASAPPPPPPPPPPSPRLSLLVPSRVFSYRQADDGSSAVPFPFWGEARNEAWLSRAKARTPSHPQPGLEVCPSHAMLHNQWGKRRKLDLTKP